MANGVINQPINNSSAGCVKMPDGTAICWGQITVSGVAISSSWGSIYDSTTQSVSVTFPITFVGTPSLTATAHTAPTSWLESIAHSTSGISGYFLARGSSSPSVSGTIDWCAIGRWK